MGKPHKKRVMDVLAPLSYVKIRVMTEMYSYFVVRFLVIFYFNFRAGPLYSYGTWQKQKNMVALPCW